MARRSTPSRRPIALSIGCTGTSVESAKGHCSCRSVLTLHEKEIVVWFSFLVRCGVCLRSADRTCGRLYHPSKVLCRVHACGKETDRTQGTVATGTQSTGSSGAMETEAAKIMWGRSVNLMDTYYMPTLGDNNAAVMSALNTSHMVLTGCRETRMHQSLEQTHVQGSRHVHAKKTATPPSTSSLSGKGTLTAT